MGVAQRVGGSYQFVTLNMTIFFRMSHDGSDLAVYYKF